MNTKFRAILKRCLAACLAVCMVIGLCPGSGIVKAQADTDSAYVLENAALHIETSKKNGGFHIRTTSGDKINKLDDGKDLLYQADEDNTSFVSFEVTRNGKTKEYIFGNTYKSDKSSAVTVSRENDVLKAVWTVADITFTQSLQLINSGSNEHGMAYISVSAENKGEPADIRCRLLLDTAMGDQDYAYYNIGDGNNLVSHELSITGDDYDKSFYAVDNPFDPAITSYIVNAAINKAEVKPYKVTFAHWASLAATIFDYTPDTSVSFTSVYNVKHLTADSAAALYYDMGNVAKGATGIIAVNYGVYSNEDIDYSASMAINVNAPAYIEKNSTGTGYKDDGKFSIKCEIDNISDKTFERVRIVVNTTGGIKPVDDSGNVVETMIDKPYTKDIVNFTPKQRQQLTLNFVQPPRSEGAYAKVGIKIYDISSDATLTTSALIAENLLGEEKSFILVPGLDIELPQVKFLASSPEILYNTGRRTFNVTGDNFGMLINKSEYRLLLERKDGAEFGGAAFREIPSADISIDTDKNQMMIVMDDKSVGELPEGDYKLTFDYTDTSKADDSAPALEFKVTKLTQYKNTSYGLVAIVKDEEKKDNGSAETVYRISAFETEAGLKQAKVNPLLVFRGVFDIDTEMSDENKTVFKGISSGDDDNVMTINDSVSICNGTTVITEDNGSVWVDFDAKLSSGKYTFMNGKCALTKLKRGHEYRLIRYKSNGKREAADDFNTISLVWPSVGQAAQNILGYIMDFKYGEFGEITDKDGNTAMVVSFGATLDLSFIIPSWAKIGEYISGRDAAWIRYLDDQQIEVTWDDIRDVAEQIQETVIEELDLEEGSTGADIAEFTEEMVGFIPRSSATVHDILFSSGKLIGFNAEARIALPAYVEGMPEASGKLKINTIGDWSAGFSGKLEFADICKMQAELSVRSKNGFPVPDSFSFYVGSSTPGVMLDPFGVLWLQGAGGGIKNIYDTIFLTDKIPPLRLMLEAQLSILQVISGRGSIEAGLTGFKLGLMNGKVAHAITVLKNAQIALDWYPEVKFIGAVDIAIFNAIHGGGYMVLEPIKKKNENDPQKYFFEFFVDAMLKVPPEVPFGIGGMTLASVGMGVNKEKIFGVAKVMQITVGLEYRWGDGEDQGLKVKGGQDVQPSYPELIGWTGQRIDPEKPLGVPVYYDEEKDRTLYAYVGTNIRPVQTNEYVSPAAARLESDRNSKKRHKIELSGSDSKILTLTWEDVTGREKALEQLKGSNGIIDANGKLTGGTISITEDPSGNSYDLILVDPERPVEEQTNANANLSYNSEAGEVTLAVTFTGAAATKKYNIETAFGETSAMLYEVSGLPELSENSTIGVNGADVTGTLTGTGLDSFDTIRIVAKNKADTDRNKAARAEAVRNNSSAELDAEESVLLFSMDKPEGGFNAGSIALSFKLPEDLPSGDYYMEIAATDENMTNTSMVRKTFSFVNPNTPATPADYSVLPAGDYRLDIVPGADGNDYDGYAITVYDSKNDAVTGLEDMFFFKNGESIAYDENGHITLPADNSISSITVGGQYTYSDESLKSEENPSGEIVAGLKEGSYKISLRKWKKLASTDTGAADKLVYSEAVEKNVTVSKPNPATLTVNPLKTPVQVTVDHGNEEVSIPAFTGRDVKLSVNADQTVSGTWELDGGIKDGMTDAAKALAEGTFDNTKQKELEWKELEDGVHTLKIFAKNGNGDASATTYVFGVDTMAPNLMISSPLSGGFFDSRNAKVTVSGKTDALQVITVSDATTGKAYSITAGADGSFSQELSLEKGYANHVLTISTEDEAGNKAVKEVSLLSDDIGSIRSVAIYANEKEIGVKDALAKGTYDLVVYGIKADGSKVNLNGSSLVEWQAVSVNGDAKLDAAGNKVTFTVGDGAEGIVSAKLMVHDRGGFTSTVAFRHDAVPAQTPSEDRPQGNDYPIYVEPEKEPEKETAEDTKTEEKTPENGQTATEAKPEKKGTEFTTKETAESKKAGISTAGKYRVTKDNKVEYVAPKTKKSGNVQIPDTVIYKNVEYKVTSIGKDAFKKNKYIKTLVIGKNVTKIGENAFYGCKNLTSVKETKGNLKTVGKGAFTDCTALKSVKLTGKALTTISDNAFRGCTNLKTLKINSTSLKKIGANAFRNCKKLKTFEVTGTKLETIGSGAFRGCVALKKLDLKDAKLKTIGAKAFYGCSALKTIYLNVNSLKKVESKAFKGLNKNVKFILYAKSKTVYKKAVELIKAAGAGKAAFEYVSTKKSSKKTGT